MKKIGNKTYLKIGEVAKILDRSPQMIKIWYEYAEQHEEVKLPDYRTDLDNAGSRYFLEEDVMKLEEFQQTIQRGMMAEVTSTKWGQRGKKVKHYGLNRFDENEI